MCKNAKNRLKNGLVLAIGNQLWGWINRINSMPYGFKLPFHLGRDDSIHNSSSPRRLSFVKLPRKE